MIRMDPYFLLVCVVVSVLVVIVHVSFAVAVWLDTRSFTMPGDKRFQKTKKRPLVLVPPFFWALATLLGGVFCAGIYWAIHHSTLRPPDPAEIPLEPGAPVTG